MHGFDWDDIRVFLAIVEHGSLNQAADYLGINQSTVSRRISALEERLGVGLFERKRGSRWAVTPAGEQMRASAELMNDYANAIARDVLSNSTEVRGHVTVTFGEVGTRHVAAPALAELASQYPELSLTLLVDNNPLNLAAREADVAIRISDTVPEDVVAGTFKTPDGVSLRFARWAPPPGRGHRRGIGSRALPGARRPGRW